MTDSLTPRKKRSSWFVLMGGLLPVIAFTVFEEYYGPMAGVIAGIVFGCGEMIYEYWSLKRIQGVTLASNAMVIVLGGFSLWKSDGVLFKLQPAFLFMGFSAFMIGSSLLKKPFLVEMMKKQHENPPEASLKYLSALNVRMGICVFVLGLIGVHAAYYWTTPQWAAYKAIGAPVLMIVYMVLDIFIVSRLRRRN